MNRHLHLQRELAALASAPRPVSLSNELQAHLHTCPECRAQFTAWQELRGELLTAKSADAVSPSAVHSLHRRLQQALTEPPRVASWSRLPRQIALCAAIIVTLLTLSNLPISFRQPETPLPPPTLWTYTIASPETLDYLLEQHAAQLLSPSPTPIPYAFSSYEL